MVLLDGFTQLHLVHGLLDNEVYFYNEKSLAIKLHCQKEFTELLLKGGHLWPAAQNRQSSTESPNLFTFFLYEYKCIVTLTMSGWFIIKVLTCISRPLFRRRSCFMFVVPSRYFLSRQRAENVCYEVCNGMYSS